MIIKFVICFIAQKKKKRISASPVTHPLPLLLSLSISLSQLSISSLQLNPLRENSLFQCVQAIVLGISLWNTMKETQLLLFKDATWGSMCLPVLFKSYLCQ